MTFMLFQQQTSGSDAMTQQSQSGLNTHKQKLIIIPT